MVTRTLSLTTPDTWRIAGDVDTAEAEAIVAACRSGTVGDAVSIDLGELELLTGAACGLLVDAVRALLDRDVRVTLVEPPQNLAHVIYRVGLLPRVILVRPRFDEPTSS